MAIQYVAVNALVFQTADFASLPSDVPINYQAWNTQTGKMYLWNGTAWIPKWQRTPYKFIVFRDENTVYCQDHKGYIVSSSPSTTYYYQYSYCYKSTSAHDAKRNQ